MATCNGILNNCPHAPFFRRRYGWTWPPMLKPGINFKRRSLKFGAHIWGCSTLERSSIHTGKTADGVSVFSALYWRLEAKSKTQVKRKDQSSLALSCTRADKNNHLWRDLRTPLRRERVSEHTVSPLLPHECCPPGALTHDPQSPGSSAPQETTIADMKNLAASSSTERQNYPSELPRCISSITWDRGTGGSHVTRRLVAIGSEGEGADPEGSTT